MWKCHKCGKPVYFAERKQSLGFDWHPECLRCEECGKRLNPGQHAEHRSIPYCHVPCYGALFGPQLFGHGSTVESHKNFGQTAAKESQKCHQIPTIAKEVLDCKVKQYNEHYDNRSMEIRSREVNGRQIIEGALRVYWGVQGVIHLKEDDDQRTVVTIRKRNSCRYPNPSEVSDEMKQPLISHNRTNNNHNDPMSTSITSENGQDADSTTCESCSWSEDAVVRNGNSDDYEDGGSTSKEISPVHNNNSNNKSTTLPSKLDVKQVSSDWDEIDDLLQVERKVEENDKLYQTMPSPLPTSSSLSLITAASSSDSTSDYKTAATSDKTLTQDYTPDSLNSKQESETNLLSEPDTTSTLKPEDYEDFRKRVQREFLTNTNELRTSNDGTMKVNQPIDPSRINDSMKLYGQNIMSKSFNGVLSSPNHSQYEIEFENALRQYETMHHVISLENDEKIKYSRRMRGGGGRPGLQKSESSSTCTTAEQNKGSSSSDTIVGSLSKSKSGPNCFRGSEVEDDSDIDDLDEEATLRPSTMRRHREPKSISIKMDCYDELEDTTNSTGFENEDGVVLRKPPKTGSTAIKRRSGNRRSRTKLKRRCSINGHFYNRETSFFTPPHGAVMSVWATSLVDTRQIINLILEKYKVDSRAENFALFIVRDNGEQRRVKEDDFPLLVRVMLGPHEDVARLFLVDSHFTPEISSEVAQFINLSINECRSILNRYQVEQQREEDRIREKYAEMKRRIIQRMESLKVRL